MNIEEREKTATQGFIEDAVENAINSLARIINAGFEAAATKLDIERLSERIDGLEKSIMGMHDNFTAVFADIRKLRGDMENINTRADVVDLQVRVKTLEDTIRARKNRPSGFGTVV